MRVPRGRPQARRRRGARLNASSVRIARILVTRPAGSPWDERPGRGGARVAGRHGNLLRSPSSVSTAGRMSTRSTPQHEDERAPFRVRDRRGGTEPARPPGWGLPGH
jgi:hypothetical protein